MVFNVDTVWPASRRVTSMPSSAANESGLGPVMRGDSGYSTGGRRRGGQAAGHRHSGGRPPLPAGSAQLVQQRDRARVVLDRPRLDDARRLHVVEELLALLRPQQSEGPVAERADAPRRDVRVLGGEVRAALTA